MMQFTRFTRKVFTTKILLSGKFCDSGEEANLTEMEKCEIGKFIIFGGRVLILGNFTLNLGVL